MEEPNGFVTVTPLGDRRSADIRVCSPDATGLGCDFARTMFDVRVLYPEQENEHSLSLLRSSGWWWSVETSAPTESGRS
jgi:hypothetical protein